MSLPPKKRNQLETKPQVAVARRLSFKERSNSKESLPTPKEVSEVTDPGLRSSFQEIQTAPFSVFYSTTATKSTLSPNTKKFSPETSPISKRISFQTSRGLSQSTTGLKNEEGKSQKEEQTQKIIEELTQDVVHLTIQLDESRKEIQKWKKLFEEKEKKLLELEKEKKLSLWAEQKKPLEGEARQVGRGKGEKGKGKESFEVIEELPSKESEEEGEDCKSDFVVDEKSKEEMKKIIEKLQEKLQKLEGKPGESQKEGENDLRLFSFGQPKPNDQADETQDGIWEKPNSIQETSEKYLVIEKSQEDFNAQEKLKEIIKGKNMEISELSKRLLELQRELELKNQKGVNFDLNSWPNGSHSISSIAQDQFISRSNAFERKTPVPFQNGSIDLKGKAPSGPFKKKPGNETGNDWFHGIESKESIERWWVHKMESERLREEIARWKKRDEEQGKIFRRLEVHVKGILKSKKRADQELALKTKELEKMNSLMQSLEKKIVESQLERLLPPKQPV